MDSKNKSIEELNKTLEEAGLSIIDNKILSNDLTELTKISNSLPKDNRFSTENCLKLERFCIRGMNICDYWYPIIHIVLAEQEVERDTVKNKSYITAEEINKKLGGKDGKLTAEMRKACSEVDEEYNKIKIVCEKLKAMKLFFEKKRDTFKSAIFIFKDQLAAYKMSDKGSSGENLDSPSDDEDDEDIGDKKESPPPPSNVSYGKTTWERK